MTVEKILAIVGFAFILGALCVAVTTPFATSYELSIYDAYPSYFWFFLFAAISCGIMILLYRVFFGRESSSWILGLVLVLFANTLFLLLPAFRGYSLYGRYDTLAHLGDVKDVVNNGHVRVTDFYPVTAILGAILVQLTGLSLGETTLLFSVLFSAVCVLGIYPLAKSISGNIGKALLVVAFASPLVYGFFFSTIHPAFYSILMIPYALYFYQRRDQCPNYRRENTALAIFLTIFIVFFHPITEFFVTLTFCTFGLAYAVYGYFTRHSISESTQRRPVGKRFLEMGLIAGIAFLFWSQNFQFLQNSFKDVYISLFSQGTGSHTSLLQSLLSKLTEAGLTPIQDVELLMVRYGAIFIFLAISVTASIVVIVKSLSGKHRNESMRFTYIILFVMSLFVGVLMLLAYFVEFDPVRVLRLSILFSVIVDGLVVYDFFVKGLRKSTAKIELSSKALVSFVTVGAILMSVVALSMISVYGSPTNWNYNQQVTQADIRGVGWFGSFKNPYFTAETNIPVQLRDFESYVFGTGSSLTADRKVDSERLPSHFGYDQNDSIVETLGLHGFENRYLIITGLDKAGAALHSKCPSPEFHVYTTQDNDRLASDLAADRIYSNGAFEVWRIYGKGG